MGGHFWEASLFKGPKGGTPQTILRCFWLFFQLIDRYRKSQHEILQYIQCLGGLRKPQSPPGSNRVKLGQQNFPKLCWSFSHRPNAEVMNKIFDNKFFSERYLLDALLIIFFLLHSLYIIWALESSFNTNQQPHTCKFLRAPGFQG